MQQPFRFEFDEDTENYYFHGVTPKSQVAVTLCNPANDDREYQETSPASQKQKPSTQIEGFQTSYTCHSGDIPQIVILESDDDQISYSNDKTHYSYGKRSETDLYVPESDSESDETVLENDFSSVSASPEDDMGSGDGINSANMPDSHGFVTNDEVEDTSYAPSLVCCPTQLQDRPEDDSPQTCPFCDYESASLEIIRKHYDTHTAVKGRCPQCKVHSQVFYEHVEGNRSLTGAMTCGQSANTSFGSARC